MHPVTTEVIAARRADLLREAEHARRVAAARRRGALEPRAWRARVGGALIGLGEAVAGRPRAALALPQSERRA
jgi:hypothetical protein